ncbi:MAG: UDP-N-acetylmuramoyl-L-alanyl-D-glutamate--2,6-diaminopimelate ligase [bacterium]
MDLRQLLTALSKKQVRGRGNPDVIGVTQDSRCVQPGFVFVCISGYQLDGHDYIEDAIRRGAVAVVVEKDVPLAGGEEKELPSAAVAAPEEDALRKKSAESSLSFVRVRDGREALALLSAELYRHPSRNLRVIGITGTNGKTTTSYLVTSILEAAGFSVGLTNTLTCRIKGEETASVRTTPESVDLQRTLRQMADAGCKYAVVEVSSHSLVLNRILGCEFDIGILTNITSDHLDFHKTFAEYRQAKQRLFSGLGSSDNCLKPHESGGAMLPPIQPDARIQKQPQAAQIQEQPIAAARIQKRLKAAVLNLDDPSFSVIRENTSVPVLSYGLGSRGDWHGSTSSPLSYEQELPHIRADRIVFSPSGMNFQVHTPKGSMEIHSRLVGLHNVSNILAAIGAGVAEGIDLARIREGVERIFSVPGRFEIIDCGQDFWVVVDFAHTADALQNLLQTARQLGPRRIMTVFGCGGDRDRSKRFPMGQVAATLSDNLIITSDNPRSENPWTIARKIEEGVRSATAFSPPFLKGAGEISIAECRPDMDAGCKSSEGTSSEGKSNEGKSSEGKYEIILDRYQAIEKALLWARASDMVLIAGKGHEQYQVIGSQCSPFDDRQVARQILTSLVTATAAEDKKK